MKMARLIGLGTIIASLAAAQLPAAAMETVSAVSESEAMKSALIAVKERVEIPSELTEFTGTSSSIGTEGSFRFVWSDKNGSASVNLNCDSKGRILTYSKYDYNAEELPTYIGVTREQAQAFAEEFLMKIAPEAFADENDRLICDNYSFNSYSSGGSYSFSFTRYYNGNKVRFNVANVDVTINGDEMKVEYASVPFDYSAVFEPGKTEIVDAEAAYEQAFPMEMIYTDVYKSAKAPDEKSGYEARLVYRIENDAEYISAYTGEVLENEENEAVPLFSKNESAVADAVSTGAGNRLTAAELEEIGQIASLKSEEECVEYLKSIPMLQLPDTAVSDKFSALYKSDSEHDEYTRSLNYSYAEGKHSFAASFDAVRGRLTYFSNNEGYRPYATSEPMTEAEKAESNEQIDAFLDIVASDVLGEFEREENNERDSEVCRRYVRLANELPYISNTLYVDYDAMNGRISDYSLTYNNHAEFADPTAAIGAEGAYDCFFEISPVQKGYVKFGDEYKLVYYTNSRPMLDAITGKTMTDSGVDYVPKDVVYTDIDNHWSKAAVNFLRDMGLAFNGPVLNPDTAVTQAELLRLFAAGIKGNWLMTDNIDTIYDRCYSLDVLTEPERNDNAVLTREQAFVYMVRLAGYDKVARLQDIYKVKYADGDMLSEGYIGYAAILSGMGIINGDGSTIRPKDCITRAEALTMVYNYMTSKVR